MTTHGLSNNPLYYVWKNMLARCYNSNHPSYHQYGGYGVTVCAEWRTSPILFVKWAEENGYKKGKHLDKDLGSTIKEYSPSTCSFIDRTTNNQATRRISSKNTSGYRGASYVRSYKKWVSQIKVNGSHVIIGYFDSALMAGKAYDYYVTSNSLNHTINNVLETGEIVEFSKSEIRADNTSGCTGVSYVKSKNRWIAYITLQKKRKQLGSFLTKKEACEFMQHYRLKEK